MNDLLESAGTPPSVLTPAELGSLSTQQLRGQLAKALTISAQTLSYLADVWRELERRGEDLSELRVGMAVYLPLIAAHQLDAEVVVRFAGQPTLLKTIATLPIAEQRAIARGKPVQVLTVGADGTYEAVELPATALTPSQARLVFDSGRLRSDAEQRAILEAAKMTAAKRWRPGAGSRVRYDAKTDQLRIGKASASVGEVVAALAGAALMPAEDADLSAAVIVKLTEAEHKGLKLRAAQGNLSMQAYARAILVSKSVL